ncbi:MAG: flippase-like domain-containing protein [Candidatus Omnitrophica bacterium]|nr:flippase-like domain-containing protein [Candidatus Omnitrophota bacterium]
MNKRLFLLLRIAVSSVLILLLLYIMRDKYGQIAAVLKDTRLSTFGIAFLLFTTAVTIASLRLKLIIEAQGIPATFLEAVSLTFIGYFFNNFLPTAIGGDMVKAYYLSRKTHEKMGAVASIFVDRLIGLITMIFMAFVALLLVDSEIMDPMVRYLIYAITLASAAGLFFMANKGFARRFSGILSLVRPLEEKLRKAYNTVHKYRHRKALLAQSLFISVISQIFFFFSLAMLAASIGSYIPAKEIFLRMPIVSMLSLLPSINGLGLREGATVVFFGPLIGKANAFTVSILWLAVLLIVSIIGGIVYGLSPQFKMKMKDIK